MILPGEMSDDVVRSVARGLDVLIAVAEFGRAASNAEISEIVDLHPTTTLRMLETLASRQLLRQLADGTYELGARTLDVGTAFLRRISISRHASEIVQMLADRVEETASVGVLDDGRVLYIAIADGQADLGIQSVPFGRHPLYCTALGKALIADLSWEDAQEMVRRLPMEKLTTKTIVSLDALQKDLALTRKRGWAIDDRERTPGVICIAAPIHDFSGRVVAAVSISGPDFRIVNRGIENSCSRLRKDARNLRIDESSSSKMAAFEFQKRRKALSFWPDDLAAAPRASRTGAPKGGALRRLPAEPGGFSTMQPPARRSGR
jgi:IclR family transcriptional regulator, KDG regulon repressor